MNFTFHLNPNHSPTYFNVSKHLQMQNWHFAEAFSEVNFSEKNFEFHEIAAESLEYKNLLANLVQQYCPEVMPLTYCINDQNWPIILNYITSQLGDRCDDVIWILKPAMLNNGQHIIIFQNLSEIESHYLRSDRLGGEHVLQQYITQPHLLKGPERGHKYSLRMFVVLTNYAGAFLYPKGYFNIALHPYQENFADLRPHLTNEHLSANARNVIQIPTTQYELFKPFYPQIKKIVSVTIDALRKMYPDAFCCQRQRTLAIFGFDFVVDNTEKVWLIEANHGPCFPISDEHPLQQSLYQEFWEAVVASFVVPIAKHQTHQAIQYELFESIMSS